MKERTKMRAIKNKNLALLLFTLINFILAIAGVIFTYTLAYIMFQGGDTLAGCFVSLLATIFGAIGIITLFDYYRENRI